MKYRVFFGDGSTGALLDDLDVARTKAQTYANDCDESVMLVRVNFGGVRDFEFPIEMFHPQGLHARGRNQG